MNFKGGQEIVPFCKTHPDGQEESWMCSKMNTLMSIQGDYKEIFGQTFSKEVIQSVQNLFTFREEFRKL